MHARRLVVVLLVVFAASCAKNLPRDQALARAKAARAQGDFVGEALALRDACNFARDDHDLCKRADQSWAAARARTLHDARAACADVAPSLNGVDTCLGGVAQIRRLEPGDRDAAELATAAARQHIARCFADSPAWQTSIEAAVELIRCEEARAAQIDVPLYAEQVAAARVNARDQLLRLADHPAFGDRHGATAELVAAATCLAPTPQLGERARASRGMFIDRLRGSIDLRASSSTPLPDLCAAAASGLGGRAVCNAPRPNAPQLTVNGEITLLPVEHSAFDSTESVEYVAGIIRFPNPAYQPAVDRERSARQSKDQAESVARRDRSDCSSDESTLSSQSSCGDCPARAERDRSCNAAQSSESLFRSRTSEWEQTNRDLAQTPAISERDDVRTATYSVRHHTWRAPWRARLRNDGQPITAGGETTAVDRETAGVAVANVPSDPMTYPGNRWFITGARDQIAGKLAEILDEALRRRASDLHVSCNGALAWTNDWLDCWARVRFWGGAPADPAALLRVVGQASDRKRAGSWPAVQCR